MSNTSSPFRKLAAALAVLVVSQLAVPSEAAAARSAPAEIVVAIRYLQAEGTSHAHLYLFREDGRLLRQLTRFESGQDRDPIFSPDGESIVFTHETKSGTKEVWRIEPLGGGLRRLDSAPEWYASAHSSPFFTNREPEDWPDGRRLPGWPGMEGEPATQIRAPDGSVELVLGEVAGDEDNGINGPGHGRSYLLKDLKTGKETKMGELPGFEGLWELLHSSADVEKFFLFENPLRLAFFGLHLNSTDGNTSYALDLTDRRLVRLSPNWAAPIPLPGEPAFLTLTYERYLPIPGSAKTANCSYIERWNANLKKVRYAKPDTAPICYGASMYRPGAMPPVVSVREGGK